MLDAGSRSAPRHCLRLLKVSRPPWFSWRGWFFHLLLSLKVPSFFKFRWSYQKCCRRYWSSPELVLSNAASTNAALKPVFRTAEQAFSTFSTLLLVTCSPSYWGKVHPFLADTPLKLLRNRSKPHRPMVFHLPLFFFAYVFICVFFVLNRLLLPQLPKLLSLLLDSPLSLRACSIVVSSPAN